MQEREKTNKEVKIEEKRKRRREMTKTEGVEQEE